MGITNNKLELAVGSVSQRGYVDTIDFNSGNDSIYKITSKYIGPEIEVYRSMFLYDETFDGKIKEYKGSYEIDDIILDVDIKDKDMNDIRGLYAMLQDELGNEFHSIWFSGTGFHVHISDLYQLGPRQDLPLIMKLTIEKMFKNYGVDLIYDRARLIRAEYSYNIKNNTYKIPIISDDIYNLSYDSILEMAKKEPNWNDLQRPHIKESKDITIPYWEEKVLFDTLKNLRKITEIPNNLKSNTQKYTSHVTCVQKMYDNGPVIGQRHQTVLRMVSSWKRNGINEKGANALLHSWDKEFAQDKESQRILDTIYNWEHNGYGCNDPIMDKHCDSICKFYRSKDYGIEVFNADLMSNDFQEFVQVNFENKSLDLNDMYDIGGSYKFTVGELITMIGDTKLGKTAFIQNLVARANNFKCLYLSLEVNQKLMWRRFCQIAFNKTKHEVTKLYVDNDQEFIAQAKDKLGHIKILTVSPEINNILDVITNLQPTVIVIDTLDEIRVDYINDGLMKMQKIVSKLKEIAQQYEVMIFAVSHISKTAAYDGNLNRHSAKGDSSIEQKSDKLLGISAPNPQSKARVIESIVARDESGFKLRCWFNHETFRFQQVSE